MGFVPFLINLEWNPIKTCLKRTSAFEQPRRGFHVCSLGKGWLLAGFRESFNPKPFVDCRDALHVISGSSLSSVSIVDGFYPRTSNPYLAPMPKPTF